jgi:hypothetical protein
MSLSLSLSLSLKVSSGVCPGVMRRATHAPLHPYSNPDPVVTSTDLYGHSQTSSRPRRAHLLRCPKITLGFVCLSLIIPVSLPSSTGAHRSSYKERCCDDILQMPTRDSSIVGSRIPATSPQPWNHVSTNGIVPIFLRGGGPRRLNKNIQPKVKKINLRIAVLSL